MKHTDITNAIYHNEEVKALYLGDLLIYQRAPQPPTYTDNQLVGKFTDDSTEEHWWYRYVNGIKITLPVYTETKTFDLELSEPLTSCYEMFSYNGHIEYVYHFPDTSNVTNMNGLFAFCSNLKSIDLSEWDVSNVTDMNNMFMYCNKLTSLDFSGWDVSKVRFFNNLCQNCDKLESVNMKGFDFISATTFSGIFDGCNKLTTIIGPVYNISAEISFPSSILNNDSVMVFINGLSLVEQVKRIKFKPATYDTLTEEQIAAATSKGWTIIRLVN